MEERDLSSEDDDRDDGLTVFGGTLRESARHLEDGRGAPIGRFFLALGFESDNGCARSFRRLVAALGRGAGDGNRAVRHIELARVHWNEMPEEDVERLCRDVLPHHPTLESVATDMPPSYLTILVNSLQANSTFPLRKLTFLYLVNRSAAQAIGDMVGRNGPLTALAFQEPLHAEDCKLICQAVSRSSIIRTLDLKVTVLRGETLDDLLVASSSLRELSVIAESFTDECVALIARQLRTNTTLERLRLIQQSYSFNARRALPGPITDTLETYNVTLRTVAFHPRHPRPTHQSEEERIVRSCCRRNRRIRRAITDLEPRNYHVAPAGAWPHAFGMVSTLPTLVYRFLRRGYVNSMCHSPPLPPGTSTLGTRKRGRAIGGGDEDEGDDHREG